MAPRDPTTGDIMASGRLWDFTEKIAASRREGKNRRDGATVSTRVLKLADTLGAKLFAEAAAAAAAAADGGGGGSGRLSPEDAASMKKYIKQERRRRKLEGRAHL